MESLTPLLLVVVFWIVVHLRRRRVSAQKSLLPTTTHTHELSPNKLCELGKKTQVLLTSPVILRAETTVFSDAHSRLLSSWSKSTSSWGRFLRQLYDCGSVLAICGQLFGLGALIWSVFYLGMHILGVNAPIPLRRSLKRELPSPSSTGHILRPLCYNRLRDTASRHISSFPREVVSNMKNIAWIHTGRRIMLGNFLAWLTLPLSHLPHVLFSLIGCTAVHELGHALAAAADGVTLLSWGYSLVLFIPLAFVELSVVSPPPVPRQRLRIAAAGAYHNIITVILLSLLASTPGSIWGFLGYRSLVSGVAVMDVEADSPLRAHLVPGSLITRLDDTPLAGPSPSTLWNDVLLGDHVETKGWCVEANWFDERTRSCCASSIHGQGSCFIPHPAPLLTTGTGRCIDPLPLLENRTASRCDSTMECGEKRKCVAATSSAALTRICVGGEKSHEMERVVVWQGPRREIWEQVTVGRYVPRSRFLPLGIPHTISLLLNYMKSTSLSLFFFNLLPIRVLDGGEIFSTLLDARAQGVVDLEAGWGRRQARRVPRIVELTTLVLVGVVAVGGVVM